MTINTKLQPELAIAIRLAQAAGVQVLAYDCQVTPATITVNQPVIFDLERDY
jgi:sugar fermentation stimulation protein A